MFQFHYPPRSFETLIQPEGQREGGSSNTRMSAIALEDILSLIKAIRVKGRVKEPEE